MADTKLPTEVELVFEVMPCNAQRVSMNPGPVGHSCGYFRKWGTYHTYDYVDDGPPPEKGIIQRVKYLGRAPLVPELLSGCRKAPIISVGINPNLPGWWPFNRGALNPMFDDYKQYAHYFRYRSVAKLALSKDDYEVYGGGDHDSPFSDFELDIAPDQEGNKIVEAIVQRQSMYEGYEGLLLGLAEKMNWQGHSLSVGEDLAYGNMVACPSARWTTNPNPEDPLLPPMSLPEREGIIAECFHKRSYFLRQLFQSLPPVLLVFSQSTATALIGELKAQGIRFVSGDPDPSESLNQLADREIRLSYGKTPKGDELTARIIFSPHITGSKEEYENARTRVLDQLVDEARNENITYNKESGHLYRSPGSCLFCPFLEIGDCDYTDELIPLGQSQPVTINSNVSAIESEKAAQKKLMAFSSCDKSISFDWCTTDDLRGGTSDVDGLY